MSSDVVYGVWAAIALAAAGLQATALAGRGRVASVGDLVDRALARPWRRFVLVLGWMWLGWHVFAR